MNVQAVATLLSSVTLTDNADDNISEGVNLSNDNQIDIQAFYTTGASETSTTCDIYIDYSYDNIKWFPYASASYSSGQLTLTSIYLRFGGGAGGTEYLANNWSINANAVYFRIRAKENGSPSNAGTLTAKAITNFI